MPIMISLGISSAAPSDKPSNSYSLELSSLPSLEQLETPRTLLIIRPSVSPSYNSTRNLLDLPSELSSLIKSKNNPV